MRLKRLASVASIAAGLCLAGCGTSAGNTAMPETSSVPSAPLSASPSPTASADPTEESLVGTVVRFTAGSESVDVTIGVDSLGTYDATVEELARFEGQETTVDMVD